MAAWRGYSEVLELYLRRRRGQRQWDNLETGRAIMNLPGIQRIAEEEGQGQLAEQARQGSARVAMERMGKSEKKLRHLES